MTQAATIAEMLGGMQVLKQRIRRDRDLEAAVRGGLPARSVRSLAEKTSTTLTQLQEVTRIDRSTFARRARSHTKLKSDESDRIVRVARIAALAIGALGREDGLAWLHEPNRALGNRIPITLLDTEVGARQVEQVLGRIEHGVVS
jgi:putative toxin-antitoxin system antitoxin component (TIGR02293 family)